MTQLKDATEQELLAEMERRGIVASTWNKEDAKHPIRDDADAEDLSDEQLEKASELFLERAAEALRDIVGGRGNDFLTDKWNLEKEEILAEVRGAPAP